jgi:hypothetical protein
MTIMASGIYKRTTQRAPSPSTAGDAAASTPPDPSVPAATQEHSRDSGAAPLIGQRSILTDRAVARRARSRSKSKQVHNLKLLIAALILIIIATSMGWILSWSKLQIAESEALALDADLRKMGQELDQVRDRLAARDSEFVALVEKRIPGLKPIELNKLLDINDKYVVNLTFSESGTEQASVFEYHTVLRNETAGIVLPEVTLYLFDELGLQVGVHKLEKHNATTAVVLAELRPGETRSYHAELHVERNAKPKYYLLHVE